MAIYNRPDNGFVSDLLIITSPLFVNMRLRQRPGSRIVQPEHSTELHCMDLQAALEANLATITPRLRVNDQLVLDNILSLTSAASMTLRSAVIIGLVYPVAGLGLKHLYPFYVYPRTRQLAMPVSTGNVWWCTSEDLRRWIAEIAAML